ncbi:DUF1003 domain-containing protein [Geobacter grbiciae]|uniref:DUF1003 domain-containing protein n=1 Tax=Geobacter grbiciae TaxID=155042 RepID=UPI001FE744D2|nr:DUF1003 domain-containing protein [Geobacter grbiciae]
MKQPAFPPPYMHEHAPIKNVNEVIKERLTVGQRASDWIAAKVGSWHFIIGQSILLTLWAILNVTAWVRHWDPYPFILMNLVLSLQAAYTAPMIMMSQNRKADRDRIEAHIITKSTRRRKPKFGSFWRILKRRTSSSLKSTS